MLRAVIWHLLGGEIGGKVKNYEIRLPFQVNLCQKLLFLHQLTHNMTTDCSLKVQYMKIPSSNLRRTCCVRQLFLTFRTILCTLQVSSCSAKRRASDKDLPVTGFKKALDFFPFFFMFPPKNKIYLNNL